MAAQLPELFLDRSVHFSFFVHPFSYTSNAEMEGSLSYHLSFSQRLTVPVVHQFIADLKDCVKEVKTMPASAKQGNMVMLYGPSFLSSIAHCPPPVPFNSSEFPCLVITEC